MTNKPSETRYKIVETIYEKGETRWNVIDRTTNYPRTFTKEKPKQDPPIPNEE